MDTIAKYQVYNICRYKSGKCGRHPAATICFMLEVTKKAMNASICINCKRQKKKIGRRKTLELGQFLPRTKSKNDRDFTFRFICFIQQPHRLLFQFLMKGQICPVSNSIERPNFSFDKRQYL